MIRQNFPLRVLAACFLFLALPLLIDSFVIFERSYLVGIEEIKLNLRELATFKGLELDQLGSLSQKNLEKILEMTPYIERETLTISLVQKDGRVFASSNPKMKGQMLTIFTEKDNNSFFEYILNGRVHFAYRAKSSSIGGYVVVSAQKADLFAKEVGKFLIVYLLYAFVFLTVAAIAFLITQWLSKPLRHLNRAMIEVSQNNLSARFHPMPLGFEINELGQSFNTTLDSLLSSMKQAEQERVQKMTYQTELALGHSVQQNLFPKETPKISGVEIVGKYFPAIEVGGDFYDYGELEGGLFMVIADAAGRGVSSSFYSLTVRSFIRSYATLSSDVQEILASTNNAFVRDVAESGMFVSVQMGIYNLKSNLFTYTSLGHVPGFIRRVDGRVEILKSGGVALGIKENAPIVVHQMTLSENEAILFYTDGIFEYFEKREKGMEWLMTVFSEEKGVSAREIEEGISNRFKELIGIHKEDKEFTLLVLKIRSRDVRGL